MTIKQLMAEEEKTAAVIPTPQRDPLDVFISRGVTEKATRNPLAEIFQPSERFKTKDIK